MTKLINLSKGLYALVDDEDYEWLNQYYWHAKERDGLFYAVRSKYNPRKNILMHREIMRVPAGVDIDHRNSNGLDNQKHNLRISTPSQNAGNRRPLENGTSRFKGVCWHGRDKRWIASIGINLKKIHLGSFQTEEDAALAYNEAAKKYFREFARLNEI